MITNKQIGYSGRLGNQIFQYATLLSIALKHNREIVLPTKNINIKLDGCYDFSTNKWIPYKLDIQECFDLNIRFVDDILKFVKNTYNEKFFQYDQDVFDVPDNTSIEGYFQSEKYFVNIKNYIKDTFKFKSHINDIAEKIILPFRNKQTVGIHVRRGDAVINPNFYLIGLDYISNALNYFLDDDYNFIIISDDIPWCKNNIQCNDNVFFCESNSSYVDLCVMSKCNHNIISNSSYSWWGAWLNPDQHKKVISPKSWFKNHNINTDDLIPTSWIRI